MCKIADFIFCSFGPFIHLTSTVSAISIPYHSKKLRVVGVMASTIPETRSVTALSKRTRNKKMAKHFIEKNHDGRMVGFIKTSHC